MIWIALYFATLYRCAPTREARRLICTAAVTHMLSYLGWLRALETFGICWQDLTIIEPADGPSVGLPPGVGVVLVRLLLQTKSMQFAVADVVIAYTTASGLSPGLWLNSLREESTPEQLRDDAFVIATKSGAPWTSHHYRHRYLYPVMSVCRASGDSFLKTFDDSPGNTIPFRFWSFNTQRRSGRSEVSKKRIWTLRAATPAEVVEHGRWRLSRSSLDMPLAYLEWSIEDRACVTIVCM
jgi:hypothetical protein